MLHPPPSGASGSSAAERWRHEIANSDGFIATAAAYNHAPTGVLENAFDSASYEWKERPFSYVGYGGVGGHALSNSCE